MPASKPYALCCSVCGMAFASAPTSARSLPAPKSRGISAHCPDCRKTTQCNIVPADWTISRYVLGHGLTHERLDELRAKFDKTPRASLEVDCMEMLMLIRMARKALRHECNHGGGQP